MFNSEQSRDLLPCHSVRVNNKELPQLPARTKPRTPYGIEIIENCLSCPYRGERLFCDLPEASITALSAITSSALYPKGAKLFVEGQPARGIFILCSGRVKLSTSSALGKTLILRIARQGEVLGLPATLTGTCYELTAEVIEPAQSKFILRSAFLAFLKENGEAALRVAQQLGEAYHLVIGDMRMIFLSNSAGGKLAQFLLDRAEAFTQGNGELRVKLTMTHEEIGQMIGSARETVTRLLTNFRRNQLLQIRGSTLIIKDKSGLEAIINSVGCLPLPAEEEDAYVRSQAVHVFEE